MEDLRSALMEDSEKYVEFDEFLESLDAPMYFDFTAVDNSRPDGPSWFCARIGCNQDHEHVDSEALHRSFKLRVRAAITPTQQRQKPPKLDDAKPTPKYAHSAPAKPAASARVGSAASRALVFDTPKKMTWKSCAQKQFALKKDDCLMLTTNKGDKSESTISETCSIVNEIPASVQITHTESVENAMDANKENVPNTTCVEENCEKANLLQKKVINDCGNHHGERENSKRTTKPKPFKLLTNERRIQREANLEKNLNSEAKRETVSTLRCRDGIKSNQIGKRMQKPPPVEAKAARGKMVTLAENKLIKRKAQCHKPEGVREELGEKSPEEISSKQSVRTQSLMAPRNTHNPLANRNKVIKAKACLPVKKSLTTQQATGPAFMCRDGVTEKQIDKRVQKNPQPSEARLAHDKSVRLARAKLITNNPQCQKENQIDKRVQKLQASEARLAHGKSFRLARAKLISSNPQCHKTLQSESNKDKLRETSHKEVVVKVASSKQPLKAQSLMALRNTHSSSTRGNKVITANAHSQVKKSATAQGATGSAIVSRDGHNQIDNRMQKPQRTKAGLDLSNMAGDILMTESSQCRKVASSSSTRQRFKTPSLIEARIASSSSTQGTTFIAGKAAFSQWKKSATAQGLTSSAIRCPDGLKKNEIRKTVQKSQPIEPKLAHSKMVRFVGDNSIVTNPQCQKTDNKDILREKSHKEVVFVGSSGRLNSPSPMTAQNAQSCAPHWDEVTTEKGACSPERRPVTTSKDPNLHVRESCLNEPEMTFS